MKITNESKVIIELTYKELNATRFTLGQISWAHILKGLTAADEESDIDYSLLVEIHNQLFYFSEDES